MTIDALRLFSASRGVYASFDALRQRHALFATWRYADFAGHYADFVTRRHYYCRYAAVIDTRHAMLQRVRCLLLRHAIIMLLLRGDMESHLFAAADATVTLHATRHCYAVVWRK